LRKNTKSFFNYKILFIFMPDLEIVMFVVWQTTNKHVFLEIRYNFTSPTVASQALPERVSGVKT